MHGTEYCGWSFLNCSPPELPGVLIKIQSPGPYPRGSDLVCLKWGLRTCMMNKYWVMQLLLVWVPRWVRRTSHSHSLSIMSQKFCFVLWTVVFLPMMIISLKDLGCLFNFMCSSSSISELSTCSILNKDLFSSREEGQQKTSYLSCLATFKISPSGGMLKVLRPFSLSFQKGDWSMLIINGKWKN